MIGMHILCLPIISQRMTPRFLACLGGPILGLIAGMQLMDMCFDLIIVFKGEVSDGIDRFPATKVAYMYYHTVLNAPGVNAVLIWIILVSFLGSIVGLGRSTPHMRRQWYIIGTCMAVGTSGYLVYVVPLYMRIRFSTMYDPALFDGWNVVLVARMVLYAGGVAAMPALFGLQTQEDKLIVEKPIIFVPGKLHGA